MYTLEFTTKLPLVKGKRLKNKVVNKEQIAKTIFVVQLNYYSFFLPFPNPSVMLDHALSQLGGSYPGSIEIGLENPASGNKFIEGFYRPRIFQRTRFGV